MAGKAARVGTTVERGVVQDLRTGVGPGCRSAVVVDGCDGTSWRPFSSGVGGSAGGRETGSARVDEWACVEGRDRQGSGRRDGMGSRCVFVTNLASREEWRLNESCKRRVQTADCRRRCRRKSGKRIEEAAQRDCRSFHSGTGTRSSAGGSTSTQAGQASPGLDRTRRLTCRGDDAGGFPRQGG
jgi:hypothetical protein